MTSGGGSESADPVDLAPPHAKIGQLTPGASRMNRGGQTWSAFSGPPEGEGASVDWAAGDGFKKVLRCAA